jgi:hypothetical protein
MVKALLPHYHAGRGVFRSQVFIKPHRSCSDFVGVFCVDKLGQFVYYERPTEMELTQILARGMTLQEMVRHWIFVTEYQYEVLMGTGTQK